MARIKKKSSLYLKTSKKGLDPVAIPVSIAGLAFIFLSLNSRSTSGSSFIDPISMSVVVGGTIASIIFQYEFIAIGRACRHLFKTLTGSPERQFRNTSDLLDQAILSKTAITDLSSGTSLTGDLLNDVIYMHNQGLVYKEIEKFVETRLSNAFFEMEVSAQLFRRASLVAPALGLFGTVMGLIGVLRSLSSPTEIGPSMSLALMTTAYGAILGSLVFSPLAGRLEFHNQVTLEVQGQIVKKIGILLGREDRNLQKSVFPERDAA